jgi:ParB family transcriptional regulator, chromosome partitioning protein
MIKKRGLGRSLDMLLAESRKTDIKIPKTDELGQKSELRKIPIEFLQRGQYQPRNDMNQETLEELANSIRSQGIIQPIVVRPVSDECFEIIAGERRWRAAQLAGLTEIPALVRDIPDEAAIAMSLIENIQRENLNPLEEANALQRLIAEFQMTHEQVAESVGKSRTTVTNFLRLLNLNHDVKILLEHGDLEMGHARALLALKDEKQNEAAQLVVAKELSVRETEKLVKNLLSNKPQTKQKPIADPNIKQLQNDLSEKLSTKVAINHTAKGKGKLVIQYNSLDELEGILEHIK